MSSGYIKKQLVFKYVLLTVAFSMISEETYGHIIVYKRETPSVFVQVYNDQPAIFGPDLPANGLKLSPYKIVPQNIFGCLNYSHAAKERRAVIIVPRGNCSFEIKVRRAQEAKYAAVIVYNDKGDDLETMSAENNSGINIPSVFVGQSTGKALEDFAHNEYFFIINDELPFNINTQLILPFSILIVMCFLIMVFYMIYKCIREQRRLRRYRLPKRMLKKLPILIYTKNNTDLVYETCVICLDDFADGDKLRVLPCKHPYHSHCIDPWLTENKRVCPICKRKVFTRRTSRSRRNRQPLFDSNVSDSESDTTPLLQQQVPRANVVIHTQTLSTAGHGTFEPTQIQRHWPFTRRNDASDIITDDENILVRPSVSSNPRRMNPFNRAQNSQLNITAQEERPQPSIWDRLKFNFIFGRGQTNSTINEEPRLNAALAVSDSQPTPDILVPVHASNNILNPNLSGSFKDDDDEPILPRSSIYEAIGVSTPNSENSAEASGTVNTDSVFLLPPTHGNIGVVALPNSDRDASNQRDFIV